MPDNLVKHSYFYFVDGYSNYKHMSLLLLAVRRRLLYLLLLNLCFRGMSIKSCNALKLSKACDFYILYIDWILHENFDGNFSGFRGSRTDYLTSFSSSKKKIWYRVEKVSLYGAKEIVVYHMISSKGIKVDNAKIYLIVDISHFSYAI